MNALPPGVEKGVFYAHTMRDIDAPVEKVWDILTDLPKYHEWNPFVRTMTIVDASKKEEADQTLSVDRYLLMKCHIPPTMNDHVIAQNAFERITVVDKDNHRLSWINIDYPAWALNAHRWQTLTVENGVTKYETWEVFGGVLAYLVKWFIGKNLQKSFDGFADGLKTRSEQP